MHCHSRASRRPASRLVAPLGIPESCSPPELVYEQARARGMDLVTLTDHDTIDGAMELVERGFDGVVVGQEITTHFPEDRCRVHVLAWGLTPELNDEIEELGLRDDVYALAGWLEAVNLAHSLAHPLYDQNGRLSADHLERCALLFKGWELLNGAHAPSHRPALERFLASLTPARMQDLQSKHHRRALWMRPWLKSVTAGSDDHALLNVGRTWVQVEADDADGPLSGPDFLRRIMAGRGVVAGAAGGASPLAHQILAVTARHAATIAAPGWSATARASAAPLLALAGAQVSRPSRVSVALSRLGIRLRGRRETLAPLMSAIRDAIAPVLKRHPGIAQRAGDGGPALGRHREAAAFFDELAAAVTRSLAAGLATAIRDRDLREAGEQLVSALTLLAAQGTHVYALFHQNRERPLIESLEDPATLEAREPRVLLFTDTLNDINGVARFISSMAERAAALGRELHVATSSCGPSPTRAWAVNLGAAWSAPMPGYPELEIVLPPVVEMLRHADALQPDMIHVSTPGPMGLVGLLAAKMLRVPVVGVYHTDFAAYIDRLFDDAMMSGGARAYTRWFYAGLDRVLARSASYANELAARGLDDRRIAVLRPGVDTALFNPDRRDPAIWSRLERECGKQARGISRRALKVLYVGRLSVEKNLGLLAEVWKRISPKLSASLAPADLVVVGEGPYRAAMEKSLRGTGAHFLGFRHGEELATIYASADLFVFPSTTDTLGQVVMEGQASGVPVLVSDIGGPREQVLDGESGLVLPARDAAAWESAIVKLLASDQTRQAMGRRAAEQMRGRDLDACFGQFWEEHANLWREHRRLGSKGRTGLMGKEGAGAQRSSAAASARSVSSSD